MFPAIIAAVQGVDAATGSQGSSWVSSLFGGGASSDQEKAARALSGTAIQAGPYSVPELLNAMRAGGGPAVEEIRTAVELKDFMAPSVWGGSWTPELLATAAVYFAHGAVDGVVAKNEKKIRDAVGRVITQYGGLEVQGTDEGGAWGDPILDYGTPTVPNFGGSYTAPQGTVDRPSQAGVSGSQILLAVFVVVIIGGVAALAIKARG